METTLNNGLNYRFEEFIKGYISTYCFWDGKWNHICKSFHSWEEVNSWIEIMNKPVEVKPATETYDYFNSAPDYYGCGRYCGD